jgi:soluble lytic murein transglycosylase-like protein
MVFWFCHLPDGRKIDFVVDRGADAPVFHFLCVARICLNRACANFGAGRTTLRSTRRPPTDASAEVPATGQNGSVHKSLCPMIQFAAAGNDLPVEFFARLIWQESRIRPEAVGPLTRGGGRAQGIAQFMPSTAAERLILNPFDPSQALPKAAEFLRQLRTRFGNLGLAAAAL